MASRRPWLGVEVEVLQRMFPDYGPERVVRDLAARGFERTVRSVKWQAKVHGLKASERRLARRREEQSHRATATAQEMWNTMSVRERARRSRIARKHNDRYWTGENRRQHAGVMSEATSSRWQSATERDKENHREKCRAAWERLTDEQKARHAINTVRRNKTFWASLTKEERSAVGAAIGDSQGKRWASLTEDERSKLAAIASRTMKKVWRDAPPDLVARMLAAAHSNSRKAQARNNLRSPNKAEEIVCAFDIPGLRMTLVDSGYRVILNHPDGTPWRKNPDFAFGWKGPLSDGCPRLVVEIMGFGKWHSRSEVAPLVAEYAKRGVRCLVFGAKEVHRNPNRVKAAIQDAICDLANS